MSEGDFILVPVRYTRERSENIINFVVWEDYYAKLKPKTYKLGRSTEEICALKYLLNKYFFGSKILDEENGVADKNFFKAMGILSVACGAGGSYAKNTFSTTKELIQKFQNPEKLASFKNTDIYKIAKKRGFKNISFDYIRYMIALQKRENARGGIKKMESARVRCYNMPDVYQIITSATKKAMEEAAKKYGFNVNKLIETAAQKSSVYDCTIEYFLSSVIEASLLYNVDPALIVSIIEIESGFDREPISDKDAYGMMQITSPAYEEVKKVYGVSYDYKTNTRQNISCGGAYLNISLNNFRGDMKLALAAYNAGVPTIEQHNGIPGGKNYIQTKEFVKNVLNAYQQYRRA